MDFLPLSVSSRKNGLSVGEGSFYNLAHQYTVYAASNNIPSKEVGMYRFPVGYYLPLLLHVTYFFLCHQGNEWAQLPVSLLTIRKL